MADPIVYTIVRNLQTALRSMTVAGGYYFAVASLAVKLDPNQDVDALIAPDGPRPFVVLEVKPDAWTYEQAGRAVIVLPVTIHWVSESDPTEDNDRLLTFTRGVDDVRRALTRDITRGGLAVDTRITKATFDTAVSGSQVWAIVDTEIKFHQVYRSP